MSNRKAEPIDPQIWADSTDSKKAGQLFLWINLRKSAKSADTSDECVDRFTAHGKNRQLVQAAWLHLSIQRNLRRTKRCVGLWTTRRRTKAQPEELLVARNGPRAR